MTTQTIKALTVQQPWAWAIVHGGKDVENRTQAWTYRGPLLIHAGARLSQRGCELLPDLLDAAARPGSTVLWDYAMADLAYGAVIGVVDLVGVHPADVCEQLGAGERCSPWAESSYNEHGGRTRRDVVHLELADPRVVEEPIPCPGRLGLWTPPAAVLKQLERL